MSAKLVLEKECRVAFALECREGGRKVVTAVEISDCRPASRTISTKQEFAVTDEINFWIGGPIREASKLKLQFKHMQVD